MGCQPRQRLKFKWLTWKSKNSVASTESHSRPFAPLKYVWPPSWFSWEAAHWTSACSSFLSSPRVYCTANPFIRTSTCLLCVVCEYVPSIYSSDYAAPFILFLCSLLAIGYLLSGRGPEYTSRYRYGVKARVCLRRAGFLPCTTRSMWARRHVSNPHVYTCMYDVYHCRCG